LYEEELEEGKYFRTKKTFTPPYNLIFVGRLEEAKGVGRILDSLTSIQQGIVRQIHLVGDGPEKEQFEKRAEKITIPIYFHGHLSRDKVHELLKKSEFLLLPSTASEGFPKVIAEGACYGVIPIVSSISSVPYYINNSNGFLWNTHQSFMDCLQKALETAPEVLEGKKGYLCHMAAAFSFKAYYEKLNKTIF